MKIVFVSMLLSLLFISCTKSGTLTGSGANSTGSFGSTTGSVNGGLANVAGATVNLMMAGNATPLASAITASDGSFTVVYNGSSGNNLLYLAITGGNAGGGINANNQFLAIVGTTAAPLSSIRVNEITTAAVELVAYNFGILKDTNGAISLSTPGNAAGANNAVTQYNNLIATGTLNTANTQLASATQTGLKVMADAFASCIQAPANCSLLFNTAHASVGTAAATLLEAGLNAFNNTSVANQLYTLAFPLNSSTGFTLASASMPGGFAFINPLATQTAKAGAGNRPYGIAIDASGNLWVADNGGTTVVELTSSGALLGTFTAGTAPQGCVIDTNGNVWVSNFTSNNVTELNSSGTTVGTFSVGTHPEGIAIDPTGNIWVANHASTTVTELNSSGALIGTFTSGAAPYGIAADASGNIWVTNEGTTTVTKLNPSGTVLTTFTAGTNPISIAFDASGNAWVVNITSNNLQEFNSNGTLLGTFSTGSGSGPTSVAIDNAGNVWVSNGNINNVIVF